MAYDSMCHLDAMKIARLPLPLSPPFDKMWLKITKVCMYMLNSQVACTYMLILYNELRQ